MRMPRLEVSGKARRTAWLVIVGLFASGALSFGLTNSSPAAAASPPSQTPAPAVAPVAIRYSPGIPEVIRMVEARVDPQVIKAYIKNSPVAYNPSATELIVLKNRGISEDILTALVERGAQVKAQARQAAAAAPARPSPSAPYASSYPYPYPYQNQYAYPAYGGGYPGYAYGGYPYYPFSSAPLTSFNNSYPTYINGYPIYSGYYLPGYGYLW